MPVVTYVEFDGSKHEVDLEVGQTVMDGAVRNMLKGIVGECCGSLACSTCHCYVDNEWLDALDGASLMESEMLTCSPLEVKPGSRLGCQITISNELHGLVVHLPESQY